jgi:hypothetical protein
VPESLIDPSPNTHPGSGYTERGPDGKPLNISNTNVARYGDDKWIPEFGAGDQQLREAQTIDAVVDRLTEKYKDRNWDFSALRNPNYDGIDIESVREAAQAFDDVVTQFPFISFNTNTPLRAILDPSKGPGEKQDSNGFAWNEHAFVTMTNGYAIKDYEKDTDYISINQPIAITDGRNQNHYYYAEGMRKSETRDFNLDAMNRPVYYTIIHEMGHVMDHQGRGVAQERVLNYLAIVFEDSEDYKPNLGLIGDTRYNRAFNKWLKDKLVSNYSYTDSNRDKPIYVTEAIAEAFLDVQARGNMANEYSQKIYKLVIEAAKEANGVSR